MPTNPHRRYVWLHEAVAAAVRRRYPQLQVESEKPPGEVNGWKPDIKGGTAEQRAAAMEFAKRFAEGMKAEPGEP